MCVFSSEDSNLPGDDILRRRTKPAKIAAIRSIAAVCFAKKLRKERPTGLQALEEVAGIPSRTTSTGTDGFPLPTLYLCLKSSVGAVGGSFWFILFPTALLQAGGLTPGHGGA